MADDLVNVAVVGLGQGLENVYVTLHHPRYRLRAVCDTNPAPYDWITGRARLEDAGVDISSFPSHVRLAEESRNHPDIKDVEYIPEFKDVLARDDIDAVMLILPDPLHEQCTIEALEAGKYVVCTKPMADTIESAFRIAEAAKRHEGHYMLGFQISNGAFARTVLEVVASGVLGQPRQIRFDYHRHPWRAMHRFKNSAVDGAMVKEGTHWLDLIHRLNGQLPWRAIAGFGGSEVLGDMLEFEDNGVVVIDYEGGFRAAHTYTYYRRTQGPEEDFLLVGDKGTLRGTFSQLRLDSDAERRTIEIPPKAMPAEHHYGYVAMHDEFARMVLDGQEPYSNWRNGLENMLTCHGAQLAVSENRMVRREELAELDWRRNARLSG